MRPPPAATGVSHPVSGERSPFGESLQRGTADAGRTYTLQPLDAVVRRRTLRWFAGLPASLILRTVGYPSFVSRVFSLLGGERRGGRGAQSPTTNVSLLGRCPG